MEPRRYFEREAPAALGVLKTLVEVNSFSANRDGVNRNGALVKDLFKPLGFEARDVAAENPSYGDHVVLTKPGPGKKIVLVSHLDTVFATEEVFPWREEGPRIYGPGTNDIKGGTVLIRLFLGGLRDLAADFYRDANLTIVFDACEERGTADFIRLIQKEVQGAAACLVYEPGYPKNTIVVARKGSARSILRVRGVAAHSGSHHERGASAIVELAEKILKIAGLTDYSRGVTTNVGVVRGGTVVNTIPAYAEALIDLRGKDVESFDQAKRAIRDIASRTTIRGCSAELEEMPDYRPMPRNPETDRLFAVVQDIDPTVEPQERGGSSDACHVWNLVPTLDGLGPVGDNAHCLGTEYVMRDSFVSRAVLNFELIRRLRAE